LEHHFLIIFSAKIAVPHPQKAPGHGDLDAGIDHAPLPDGATGSLARVDLQKWRFFMGKSSCIMG